MLCSNVNRGPQDGAEGGTINSSRYYIQAPGRAWSADCHQRSGIDLGGDSSAGVQQRGFVDPNQPMHHLFSKNPRNDEIPNSRLPFSLVLDVTIFLFVFVFVRRTYNKSATKLWLNASSMFATRTKPSLLSLSQA